MGKNKNEKKSLTDNSQSEKPSLGRRILRSLKRFLIWVIITLVCLMVGLYIFLYLINKGPSDHFRDLFVASAKESSVGGVLCDIYLSQDEIDQILKQNNTQSLDEITDTSLIHITSSASANDALYEEESDTEPEISLCEDPDGDGIDIFDVHGATYSGKIMIVYDPSRVKVGVCDQFSLEIPGLTLMEICDKYDCVAGINGGKYDDEAGIGTGAMPEGIVISNGQLMMGDPDTAYGVYGLTYNNVLVVGTMTANQAISMGVRDAVTFGPALIVNGRAANMTGAGSGYNPRSAIGQREDGAILLLVIEGRCASSLGATFADIISIMQEYGAVNAANLDGGMSSSMVYNGEQIVESCTFTNARRIPTAFIVEKMDE